MILLTLIWNRFHFSHQSFPALAKLQWSNESNNQDSGRQPLVIGHRGSGLRSTRGNPTIGNTRAAIQKGIDARSDWIEIDLQLSSDGHLVVFHDLKLGKRTSGTGNLIDHSLAELKELKVLVDPPEPILTLDEVFTHFHSREQKWIFDIKAERIHREVLGWLNLRLASKEILHHQILIFGTYNILTDYKDLGYQLGYTATWGEAGSQFRTLFSPSSIINRTKDLGATHLILPVIFAGESLVQRAHAGKVEVWVYGTDDSSDFKNLAGIGITGFITDRPAQARKLFEGNH